VLGFWSSCGAFGNVLGSFITSALLADGVGWQNTFTCIGVILVAQTFVNYFFLCEPDDVGVN
jgi:sugar phosphate permease